MIIKNLREFELLKIFESLVKIDDSLVSAFSKINHPISKDIISSLSNDGYINTQVDMKDTESVMIGDSPDSVLIQKKGRELNFNDKIKIGRFVRKISDKYKPEEIEEFGIMFKTFFIGDSIKPIILKGENLRKSYLSENTLGTLGDFTENCMSFKHCQPYLDLYVKNPDKVSLAVIKNQDDKVVARALLWVTDSGITVMDKVYSVDKTFKKILQKWASDMGYYYRAKDDVKPYNATLFINNGNLVDMKFQITLNNYNLMAYPFLDTFCYMDEFGILYNYIPDKITYKELRSAQGLISSTVRYEWYIDQKADSVKKINQFMRDVANCDLYDINPDLTVVLKESINLIGKNLRRIPVTFSFINGDVNLSTNNLESLEGLPKDYIYGYLDVSNNPLRSLEHCPKIIRESFDVSDCHLENLIGGPIEVGGDYMLNNNELKTLEGLSKEIKGSLIIGTQKSNTDFNKIDIREFCDVYDDIVIYDKK